MDSILEEKPFELQVDPSSSTQIRNVQDHYNSTIDDYRLWSPEGNLHVGYWRWPMNPLRRKTMLEELNRQIFSRLRVDQLREGTIADLGCGLGAVSRLGSQNFPGLRFHGLNVSETQVQVARTIGNNERVRYDCVNYHTLPWEDDCISGAMFVESLCYSQSPDEALSEVARVLKPGGRVVIADGFLKRPLYQTPRYFRSIYKSVTSNWAVPGFHPISAVDSWQEASGLKCIEQKEISWRLAPSMLQSIPLTIYCGLLLSLKRNVESWRWRQLAASGLSLVLGMQLRHFGYWILTFEKSKEKTEY